MSSCSSCRAAAAQEATLSGTVTDSTGAVLPGVTVRAVHEATGNSFEAVTDERGGFRVAVRVGAYRLTAELSGFATVTRTRRASCWSASGRRQPADGAVGACRRP